MNWEKLLEAVVKWLELAAAYLAGQAVQKASEQKKKLEGERDAALLKAELARLPEPELDKRLREQRKLLPGAVDDAK